MREVLGVSFNREIHNGVEELGFLLHLDDLVAIAHFFEKKFLVMYKLMENQLPNQNVKILIEPEHAVIISDCDEGILETRVEIPLALLLAMNLIVFPKIFINDELVELSMNPQKEEFDNTADEQNDNTVYN